MRMVASTRVLALLLLPAASGCGAHAGGSSMEDPAPSTDGPGPSNPGRDGEGSGTPTGTPSASPATPQTPGNGPQDSQPGTQSGPGEGPAPAPNTPGQPPASGDGGADTACSAVCEPGYHCELMPVTCIRAPCPPQPTCVTDSGEAGESQDGAPCGSRGLDPCPDDQYCAFEPGDGAAACGADDRGGVCRARPQVCATLFAPVCGCDGQTYDNDCKAASAGVSVSAKGACPGNGSGGGVSCDPRAILCKRVSPQCPDWQVPSVEGSCYGACVPIGDCQCDGPEACPDNNQFTCHMHIKRCGPYL